MDAVSDQASFSLKLYIVAELRMSSMSTDVRDVGLDSGEPSFPSLATLGCVKVSHAFFSEILE
jgi:hypothetical protein